MYSNFKESVNGMKQSIYGAISFLTTFVNNKCYGCLSVEDMGIMTLVEGKVKQVKHIYTDAENDLFVFYTDGEGDILIDRIDILYRITSNMEKLEKMFT